MYLELRSRFDSDATYTTVKDIKPADIQVQLYKFYHEVTSKINTTPHILQCSVFRDNGELINSITYVEEDGVLKPVDEFFPREINLISSLEEMEDLKPGQPALILTGCILLLVAIVFLIATK